jgi:hypothetical protein
VNIDNSGMLADAGTQFLDVLAVAGRV